MITQVFITQLSKHSSAYFDQNACKALAVQEVHEHQSSLQLFTNTEATRVYTCEVALLIQVLNIQGFCTALKKGFHKNKKTKDNIWGF